MNTACIPPVIENESPKPSQGAIALFVKTPGLSPVKTRLAASLGTDAAETLHLTAAQSVTSVIADACQQIPLQGYYAVAEVGALDHWYWQALPTVWQGEGGLGERMGLIYEQLLQRHPYVLLVGADIPQMTSRQVCDCAHWLSATDFSRFAFGPSFDGGFWLFGGNRRLSQALWTHISYSQPDTGEQFLNAIAPFGDIFQTDSLQDADELADLVRVMSALEALVKPTPEQQKMTDFLTQLTLTNC
ncbi:DUF2064 domain-containing protein [Methylicorpusculum oleiharenae]|uniref:TIGR04282 family arsenosugar biosynthesis glycosyltransferase n=1 Tax=Methylicorpusculum oleiharenae TaxID=1338687 RepID=UPI001359AB29|nr:DUF2064 domain-containing protein [Methylicorpusculum oleiharenae]MCD2451666.1 DUF2064 domain-containing protein [Methylicorpusculum oleiharenae]